MPRILRLFKPQSDAVPSLRGLALMVSTALVLGAATLAAQTAATAKGDPKPAPKAGGEGVHDLEFSQVKVVKRPPPPAYPAEAKIAHIQGTVVVSITIDKRGLPEKVEALEGPEELRATAVAYSKEWRFKPARLNGKAMKARFQLIMPFKLQ